MADETKLPETPPPAPDLTKAVEDLLKQHGDAAGAVRALLSERDAQAARARELETRLPAAGSVVLAGDDAAAWASYRQFGQPDEIKAGLADRDKYRGEAEGYRKAESIRSAAELTGFRPSVLAKLAADLALVVKDETGKDGKPAKVVHVQGEGDQSTPLTAYAEREWADFLPSLRAEAGRTPAGPAPRPGTTPPRPEITPTTHQAQPLRRFGI
jgi:hypothetical protein